MKYSKEGIFWKDLEGTDIIQVTNTENGVTAKFFVNEFSLRFLPFLSFRVLEELSLGAIYSGAFYLLRWLKRPEIEWSLVEKGKGEEDAL